MILRKLSFSESELLLALSFLTGISAGGAAVLLSKSISLIHNWLHGLPGGGWMNLVFPGAGMLLSLLVVRFLVRQNIGHGVTRVLVAVSKNESRISPRTIWSSLLTSAVTIGAGGSVGAEAPIVYTGAAIGSNLGRRFRLSYRNITILLGCGAAGAVAGIFKAPLAGVLFTLEILLFNISMSSMMPLLVSSVSAAVVSYLFLGSDLPFQCTLSPFALRHIPFYLLLGAFCGLCSVYFQRMTLALEDVLSKVRNVYVRWGVCAVLLGLLIFLLPPLFGEGYGSLHPLLTGQPVDYAGMTPLGFLPSTTSGLILFFVLVLVFKVFSMTLTNAGGGVGGTFGPTLFTGAIAGFVAVKAVNVLFGSALPEQNFVLVGMAGLMAGVMQAPMTAIFLIAEITGGYSLFVPLIITATVSFGVMRCFEKYSIYTKRIARTGELLTHDSDQAVLTLLRSGDLVESGFLPVRIDDSFASLKDVISKSSRNIFPVLDSRGCFQGYVSLDDVRRDMFDESIGAKAHVYNYMRSAPEYIYDDDPMDVVMSKFERSGAWNLPVVRHDRSYIGFMSKSKIFSAYRNELRQLSSD